MKHWQIHQVIPLFAFAVCARMMGADADPAFLAPAQHIGPARHAVNNRGFQGIPGVAVSAKGRLWVTWYAGPTPAEDHNNYVVLSTSRDGGTHWREILVVDPDEGGPVRAFDPQVWLAPNGKLLLFWSQAFKPDGRIAGVWCLTIENPESDEPKHGDPVRITDGVMMNKPIVLSSGEWVLPVSTWENTDNSAKMVVSLDEGRTWNIRGTCNVPDSVQAADEQMYVERKDGAIWMLARTRYGIGESVSTDRGRTWPELKPSAIAHAGARFYIHRLVSGNILLVKHGPIAQRTERSHLTAFISRDDGQTWEGGLLLDERSSVSYPDGQQAADGIIRIVYDWERRKGRHILMATFREQDALAGSPVSGAVQLRQVVSDASPEGELP